VTFKNHEEGKEDYKSATSSDLGEAPCRNLIEQNDFRDDAVECK